MLKETSVKLNRTDFQAKQIVNNFMASENLITRKDACNMLTKNHN